LASLAVVQVKDAGRYGTVQMNGNGRVHSFLEKTGSDDFGMVNAGIYVFDRAVLDHIPDGPAGLEREVFPRLLRHGVYALEQHGLFIDIGTPDDYARAQVLHDTLYKTSLEKEWRRDLEAE
jgi:NDP-sugar pyrophosphorylase family protein